MSSQAAKAESTKRASNPKHEPAQSAEHMESAPAGDVAGLQQVIGNAAVGRLKAAASTNHGGERIVASPLLRTYLLRQTARSAQMALSGLSPGRPLPDAIQDQARARLGMDTSPVRLHTDRKADERAADLGANAFAAGNDVIVRSDRFQPDSAPGRQLLLHELTHVAQYQGHQVPGPERQLEQEAKHASHDLGKSPSLRQPPGDGKSTPATPMQILRDGPTVSAVVVTLPNTITFYGSAGPVVANIQVQQDLDPNTFYSITYLPANDQFLIKPGPNEVFVQVTLTVTGTDAQIKRGIDRYKSYIASMTKPIALQVRGEGGSGSGGGKAGSGEGQGSDPTATAQKKPETKGGGDTTGDDKEGGTGTQTEQKTTPGGTGPAPKPGQPPAPPGGPGGGPGGVPGGSPIPNLPDTKGPTVQVTSIEQIEELKKRGMIPILTADKIKDKLAKQETLTFEEAAALLDALNKVIAPADKEGTKSGEKKASWLEWAKFIKENQDKFSGTAMKSGDKGLKPDDVKAILAKHHEFVGTTAATVSLDEKLKQKDYDPEVRKSWNSLADWERDLWTEYRNKYGGSAESDRKDLHITSRDKFWMALRMSPDYMDEGFREAAHAMFNDPLFLGTTLAGIITYLALWVMPEPIFSKAAAVLETIALVSMVAFSTSELINLAQAWMDLSDETEHARSIKQLQQAAEKFGKRIGGTELRILLALAMIVGGKLLPKPTPMSMPPGGGMMPATAGGPPMAGPRFVPPPPAGGVAIEGAVGTIKVVNGVIVIVGAAPGMTVMNMNNMGSGGGGGGAGSGGPDDPVKTPEPAKATEEKAPDPTVKTAKPAPVVTKPYINGNPKATVDEVRVGTLLNEEAQAGNLRGGYADVEGLKEVKGQPSPDYGMSKTDGTKVRGDLYQPESANPDSIGTNTIGKSGQADTAIIEFGRGGTKDMGLAEARVIADRVLGTPGHSITRVIVIKDGAIILNLP